MKCPKCGEELYVLQNFVVTHKTKILKNGKAAKRHKAMLNFETAVAFAWLECDNEHSFELDGLEDEKIVVGDEKF